MEIKPIISLIGPAIRTNLWTEFYESLRDNITPFEIVFVGDRRPDFKLPANFRFIYSRVKPAQCLEVASREANGEFVMPIADDAVLSKEALDKMYVQWLKTKDDRIIISPRWSKKGQDLGGRQNYFIGDRNSPLLPLGGLIRKKLWRELGGIDRRFIASCADADMALRIYEIGGQVILCGDVWEEERKKKGIEMLYPAYGEKFDRPLLDSFWVKDGRVSRKRLLPVEPFGVANLTTITQGPTGKWGSDLSSRISRKFSDAKKSLKRSIYKPVAFIRGR